MIYRIKLDGNQIYDLTDNLFLLNPTLSVELNAAGALDFKMAPNHIRYNFPRILLSDVEVYEQEDLIWYGRVIEITKDLNGNKKIHCEGSLAFFNDSIQRPHEYEEITVHDFFRAVIQNHNAQVPANRRFTIGEITVDNIDIYRKLNYESTLDVLNTMCLDAEGGYLFFRKENGENYIDWLSGLPTFGAQPVQFGLNLTDISELLSGSEIVTRIIPLGADDDDGNPITISEVNDDLDYLDTDFIQEYGEITKVVHFDNILSKTELKLAGERWLRDTQYDRLTISCSAAELSYLDDSYPPFRVGQIIRVVAPGYIYHDDTGEIEVIENALDKDLPLTKLDISLDSAVKKISIGTPEERTLTEIYKERS